MSRLPQTDDKAFNAMRINLNSRPEKRETLKEQIARMDKVAAKNKIKKANAKKLEAIMRTKPMFTKFADAKHVQERTNRWLKENEKAIAACS